MEKEIIEFNSLSAVAFKTHSINSFYIYDRFSNCILKVEPIIVYILDDVFVLKDEEITKKYAHKFSEMEIEQAINRIRRLQKREKVLLNYRIPRFSITEKKNEKCGIKKKLDNHLTQLIINVTEDCNLRCEYCLYSGNYTGRRKHNRTSDTPWGVAKKAIDFFYRHSRLSEEKYISFYGGELTPPP